MEATAMKIVEMTEAEAIAWLGNQGELSTSTAKIRCYGGKQQDPIIAIMRSDHKRAVYGRTFLEAAMAFRTVCEMSDAAWGEYCQTEHVPLADFTSTGQPR